MSNIKRIIYTTFVISLFFHGCESSSLKLLRQSEYQFRQGDISQIDKIAEILNEDTPESKEAAYALGRLGDLRATSYLVEVIQRRGAAMHEAIEAIGMLGDTRALPVLIQLIKIDDHEASSAVRILGELRDNRSVPILMQVVEERRPYFVQAIDALGDIGDSRAKDLLINALRMPPVDEPGNIKFRVVNTDPSTLAGKEHVLTFNVPDNLAPKIRITDYNIEPEGYVFIRYALNDAEYDSLTLIPEFSVNNGVNWRRASTEGWLDNISENQYQGSLVWRADKENIPLRAETRLLFKLTPEDNTPRPRIGVPDLLHFNIDSTTIIMGGLPPEVSDDVTIKYYYPNPARAYLDSFAYHFSTDYGKTWNPASVQAGLAAGAAEPDSMTIIWSSNVDLPSEDLNDVRFRVSENKLNTLGRFDETAPFHVDNNSVPVVDFQAFDDADLFNIGYTILDAEQDTVSLTAYYSLDEGRSWKQATLSGAFKNLTPDKYSGQLRWFADFDVTALRNNTIQLRIRPKDHDPGQFADSRLFYLKDIDFSKLTQGMRSGDIELLYPVARGETTSPQAQYTTDGGKTWNPATLSAIGERTIMGRNNIRVNWDFPQDISSNLIQIEAIGRSLDKIKDPTTVPHLLMIIPDLNSSSRLKRQQAIMVKRLLDKKPKWIIDGLIATLLHPDRSLQREAVAILRPVDEPNVKMAIEDYEKYWSDLAQSERYILALEREQKEQDYQQTLADIPLPTEQEMVDFMMEKGISRFKSEQFLKDIEVLKERHILKQEYDSGAVSYNEYMTKLKALNRKAAERRRQEKMEERRLQIKKNGGGGGKQN